MSVFCLKCKQKTFNEYVCDYCRYTIKEEKIIKENWIPPKKQFIKTAQKSNTITINKNTIIVIAVVIIALLLGYLAYTKYQERKKPWNT